METPQTSPFEALVPTKPEYDDVHEQAATDFLHEIGRRFSENPSQYPHGVVDTVPKIIEEMDEDAYAIFLNAVKQGKIEGGWYIKVDKDDRPSLIDAMLTNEGMDGIREAFGDYAMANQANDIAEIISDDRLRAEGNEPGDGRAILDILDLEGYMGPEAAEEAANRSGLQ